MFVKVYLNNQLLTLLSSLAVGCGLLLAVLSGMFFGTRLSVFGDLMHPITTTLSGLSISLLTGRVAYISLVGLKARNGRFYQWLCAILIMAGLGLLIPSLNLLMYEWLMP